jgi:hypothetical protein
VGRFAASRRLAWSIVKRQPSTLSEQTMLALWLDTIDQVEELHLRAASTDAAMEARRYKVEKLDRRLSNNALNVDVEKQDGTILTLVATGLTLKIVDGQAVLTGRVTGGTSRPPSSDPIGL